MEGLRNIVRFPHEFIICGERTKAECYEAIYILYCIAQAKAKHYRGAPDHDLRGEWFSSGELHRDIGKPEENLMQVLLGWSGTQEGMEPTPQPLVIEIGEPATLRGAILWGAQL
jgi:hypothetical protein